MRKEPRILIVDDNISLGKTLSFVLRHKGYATTTARGGAEAIERVREQPFMDEVLATVRQALEKQRLAVENRRRNEELAALNTIAVAASQSLELGALLPLVCESLVRVTDYEAALLYLVDEEAGEARLRAQCGVSEEFAATAQVWKLGEALTGQVAQSGEPIVGDYATDERVPSLARSSAPPWHSFAIVPIQARGRVIGTVNLASQQRFDISVDDIALLETITGQIGVAIDNAQLYEAARRRASRLEALNTVIAVAAAAVSDLPDLLEVALDHALQALGLEMGVIWLLDTPGTPASLRIVRGLSPELNAEIGLAVPPVAQAAGMDIPEPRAVEDWQSVDDRLSALGSVMGRVGIRASLTVPITSAGLSTDLAEGYRAVGLWPLVYEGRTVAAAGCYYDVPHRWTATGREAMGAFARQAAVALRNAQLYDETRRRLAELSALFEVSGALRGAETVGAMLPIILDKTLEVIGEDTGAMTIRLTGSSPLRRLGD